MPLTHFLGKFEPNNTIQNEHETVEVFNKPMMRAHAKEIKDRGDELRDGLRAFMENFIRDVLWNKMEDLEGDSVAQNFYTYCNQRASSGARRRTKRSRGGNQRSNRPWLWRSSRPWMVFVHVWPRHFWLSRPQLQEPSCPSSMQSWGLSHF